MRRVMVSVLWRWRSRQARLHRRAALPAQSRAASSTALVAQVKVSASEFKFVLSKKTAKRGAVIFKVTNVGKLSHDFEITGEDEDALARSVRDASGHVPAQGPYPYKCTVPGHAAAGMKGVFTITCRAPARPNPLCRGLDGRAHDNGSRIKLRGTGPACCGVVKASEPESTLVLAFHSEPARGAEWEWFGGRTTATPAATWPSQLLRPIIASDGHQRRRFEREARTLAGLAHEHIVRVTDYVDDGSERSSL